MQYTYHETVLKHNPLDHHVNSGKKVLKLTGIWKDAAKGDAKAVSKAISKGESPHVENEERRTPLHYAAENGHEEVVNTLLTSGASIDKRDMRGDTPLHCALRAKNEDMTLFLVSRGANMDVTNAASLSGWDMAEKISKRFYMKLKEGTRCSNPSSSSTSSSDYVKPKPVAAVVPAAGFRHNPHLNIVILSFGQYVMCLRAVPRPGAPQPEPKPAPFPATPYDALKSVHARWLKEIGELQLITNKEGSLPATFKGGCQSLKDHVTRQVELTKNPITDTMIYDSLQNDIGNLASNLVAMMIQYEEAIVGLMFKAHFEQFTISVKQVADGAYIPELTIRFVELYRNVITQIINVSDPEKSKNISDSVLNLTKYTRCLTAAKVLKENSSSVPSFVASIVDNLRKLMGSLSQVGASSALFKEEEIEVFDSAIAMFEPLLQIEGLSTDSSRIIQIFLSEISYIKEAITASPVDVDVLLNCALFVNCTCARLAKRFTQRKLTEPKKTIVEQCAGLATECGNMILLIACHLVSRNRNVHYVQMGFAVRGVAAAVAILMDPGFGVAPF